ncbi:hypothetical protein ACFVUH_08490 [Kitasatospora sp. NPDC058032]|uniref:hypothetical protein n=1 Tax=Kitasatospora sp. NPDC058032 TaxID=3346307 RepID=UPI0036DB086F
MTYVTLTHDVGLATYVASAPDRHSAQELEQAGFVRHDASGLHRLRRGTPLSVGDRMIRDAARYLNAVDYGFLRVYSEDEQRRQAAAGVPGPAQTTAPGTIRRHHVSADVARGHLVLLARFSGAYGETELLGTYPVTGGAATFYTEADSDWWGVVRHDGLDRAVADFGRPLSLPAPAGSRGDAARAASRNAAQLRSAAASATPAQAATAARALPVAQAERGRGQPF